MTSPRCAVLLCTLLAFSGAARAVADGSFGIEPIADQTIPSGKTLVVPIPAADPDGPARTYTVTVSAPTVTTGSTTVSATSAGIMATIRSGDPHLEMTVTYTDSNGVLQTDQPMEFQLFREFSPIASQYIAGLAQAGYYNPSLSGTQTFHRVVQGRFIQGGDPANNGSSALPFTYANEYSSALIFSATAGQLALANASGNSGGYANPNPATDNSEFFITGGAERTLDFGYTIFGQLLRGYATLTGIQGTAVTTNTNSGENSQPVKPVNITSVSVTPNGTDAVLILSATGVADATVTVTAAAPGEPTVSGSFTAHAVADVVNDPPFLKPVPDVTTPASPLKITLQATDLQLDLLRYGYSRRSPVLDETFDQTYGPEPFIISGTSPTFSIPLATGSNLVLATVDHWDGVYASAQTYRGPDKQLFQVGVGDKPLRGVLAPIPPGVSGTLALSDFTVATVTAGNSKDTAANLSASVNWGDGTYLSGSSVAIVKDTAARTVARFKIVASHSYTEPGEYPVVVTVSDSGGAKVTLAGKANIGAETIAVRSADFYDAGGKIKNKAVATFSDAGGVFPASAYVATVAWGDGTVSPGTVKKSGTGFEITGTHTYGQDGTFTVNSTVMRSASNSTVANATWASAYVSGVVAPQNLPPFPQAHLAQIWSTPFLGSAGSGATFVEYVTGGVAVVNSGNKVSPPGSIAFYASPDGLLDGLQAAFTTNGASSLAIPSLKPGQSVIFTFQQDGTGLDTRLTSPQGFDPQGYYFLSVVTYSDPVGDFDGSQKILTLGQF